MSVLKMSRIGLLSLSLMGFFACQKDSSETPELSSAAKAKTSSANCLNYSVEMTTDYETSPGNTIFTWTITNPNPGNGSGNTLQDLSHWNFAPGLCLDENWQDVISASYRYGTTGEFLEATLAGNYVDDIKPDPSIRSCSADDVFKFDYGTKGNTPTQYRLKLMGRWSPSKTTGYFKSGTNTGCCTREIDGIGCRVDDEDCSFSQGYWFANNAMHPNGVHPWGNTVTIGGYVYTNAEGLAIWNASNKGGISDAKKAFTQLAAIKLSGVDMADAGISGAATTIECWLGGIPKLSPANLPTQSAASKTLCGDARAAAGVISEWIRANHCD